MKLASFLFLLAFLIVSGCSHQAASLTWGTKAAIGIDPRTFAVTASYIDGFSLLDLARENSGWEIEIDSESGLFFDKETGKLTGVKKVKRFIGPQMTGYLVDLSKKDREFALEYARAVTAYWEAIGKKNNEK